MDKIVEASKDPLFVAKFWMNVHPVKAHNCISHAYGQCWEWTGSGFSKDGYGLFSFKAVSYRSHRISYYLFNGNISKDKFICHKCDNPKCVNPKHLFEGTGADNAHDRDIKGRRGIRSNRPIKKITSKSQYTGVVFYKNSKFKKWVARIFHNYKNIYIGGFSTDLEAAQAYDDYIEKNKLNRPLNFPISPNKH